MYRKGVTIVELLVAIAILGLLVALTASAVQRSRETARRTQCTNNLREIGIALSAYHDVHRVYPPQRYSFLVAILPQMEEPALYGEVNFSVAGYAPQNLAVRSTLVPSYVCPSDEGGTFRDSNGGYGSNYAGNIGSGVQTYGYNGVFSPWSAFRAADIRDGLSTTAAVAEILVATGRLDLPRLVLETPYSLIAPNQLDDFAALCNSITSAPTVVDAYDRGRPWNVSTWIWYNHVITPGGNTCNNYTAVQQGASTATSRHTGGVNVLFADGHVNFISNGVATAPWRAMGSRDGHDFVGM
jgi:prepilin-type processing-associated H-X9-DG protein/prepilin-type N-terminal cleavage/methylation domain-containing protein